MSGIALEKEALKLSAEEKAHMIDALWRSLDPAEQATIDRAWLAESRDRLEAFRRGELKALDGDATLKSIESELRR
jgi:putative addiction module component (TIGR02574 family)